MSLKYFLYKCTVVASCRTPERIAEEFFQLAGDQYAEKEITWLAAKFAGAIEGGLSKIIDAGDAARLNRLLRVARYPATRLESYLAYVHSARCGLLPTCKQEIGDVLIKNGARLCRARDTIPGKKI